MIEDVGGDGLTVSTNKTPSEMTDDIVFFVFVSFFFWVDERHDEIIR